MNKNIDSNTLFVWRKVHSGNIRLLSTEKLRKVLSLAADLEEVDNALSAALEARGIPQEIWNEHNSYKELRQHFFGRVRDFLGYAKLIGLPEDVALEALDSGLNFQEFKEHCASQKNSLNIESQSLNIESTEYKRI